MGTSRASSFPAADVLHGRLLAWWSRQQSRRTPAPAKSPHSLTMGSISQGRHQIQAMLRRIQIASKSKCTNVIRCPGTQDRHVVKGLVFLRCAYAFRHGVCIDWSLHHHTLTIWASLMGWRLHGRGIPGVVRSKNDKTARHHEIMTVFDAVLPLFTTTASGRARSVEIPSSIVRGWPLAITARSCTFAQTTFRVGCSFVEIFDRTKILLIAFALCSRNVQHWLSPRTLRLSPSGWLLHRSHFGSSHFPFLTNCCCSSSLRGWVRFALCVTTIQVVFLSVCTLFEFVCARLRSGVGHGS